MLSREYTARSISSDERGKVLRVSFVRKPFWLFELMGIYKGEVYDINEVDQIVDQNGVEVKSYGKRCEILNVISDMVDYTNYYQLDDYKGQWSVDACHSVAARIIESNLTLTEAKAKARELESMGYESILYKRMDGM